MFSLDVHLPDYGKGGYSSTKRYEDDKIYVSIGLNHTKVGDEPCRMGFVQLKTFGIDVYGGDEFVTWLVGMINDDEEKVKSSKYGLGESEFTDEDTKGDKIFILAFREAMMQIAHMRSEFIEYFVEVQNDSYRNGKEYAKREIRRSLGIYQ